MTIWNQVQSVLRKWRSPKRTGAQANPERHLLEANRNIRELIEDTTIPSAVRAELSSEFDEIEAISNKLRKGEIHIAAFGRVGVGKSSLLNALLQRDAFRTSPLHGETTSEDRAQWQSLHDGHVVLIDTPGIDELDGEQREQLARKISQRADVTLMLCESDLTDSEFQTLEQLCTGHRTVLLVLNKADRYTADELERLLRRLQDRCREFLPPNASSSPARPRARKPLSGLMSWAGNVSGTGNGHPTCCN